MLNLVTHVLIAKFRCGISGYLLLFCARKILEITKNAFSVKVFDVMAQMVPFYFQTSRNSYNIKSALYNK